jgi:putative tricarboxylic transport membrane protein
VDTLHYLMAGLAAALTWQNLLFALAGCVLGTLVGVLPGVGPAAGTAILIPLSFGLDPTGALIMLSAIYYGAMYGGTITSVLINVPGEAASLVTCIDGHEMAKQGRAGAALGVAAIGSFVGGTISTVALVAVAPPLARVALSFGPPEFFALTLAGLGLVTSLSGRSLTAGLAMAVLGLLFAMIGIDPVRGAPRFTFGITSLYDGVGFVPVAMGLFGVAEVLVALGSPAQQVIASRLSTLLPSRAEWPGSLRAIVRGTGIGFFLGLIPGVGAIIPTFVSYAVEKRLSKTPERFGRGAIEGVAGPETANNAYANAAMIPLLTLGIPSSPAIAVLMGAFNINGLAPGPFLFQQRPDLVWAVIASFFLGNALLLVLNLPLVGAWAQFLRLPYPYVCVGTLLFCMVGAYSLQQNVFDVGVMIACGIIGYGMRRVGLPIAPLVLGLILGPIIERSLRTSLEMSGGDFSIFYTRPLCLALLIAAAVILLGSALQGRGDRTLPV